MTDRTFAHIELCGLAASGKSTAAVALCDLLRRRSRPAVTATDLSRLAAARHRGRLARAILPTSVLRWMTPDMGVPALGRFVANRGTLLSVLAEALSSPDMSDDDRRAAATSLFHTATCYQMAAECLRSDEILVLEEGFTHRGLTTFGYRVANLAPGLVQRYAECIPCPSLVVVMDTPISVCVARIRARTAPPRPYMSALSDAELADCFSKACGRLETVVNTLVRRGAHMLRARGYGGAGNLQDILSAAVSAQIKQ